MTFNKHEYVLYSWRTKSHRIILLYSQGCKWHFHDSQGIMHVKACKSHCFEEDNFVTIFGMVLTKLVLSVSLWFVSAFYMCHVKHRSCRKSQEVSWNFWPYLQVIEPLCLEILHVADFTQVKFKIHLNMNNIIMPWFPKSSGLSNGTVFPNPCQRLKPKDSVWETICRCIDYHKSKTRLHYGRSCCMIELLNKAFVSKYVLGQNAQWSVLLFKYSS